MFHGNYITIFFITLLVLLVIIALRDIFQKEHVILRNYPLFGYIRYFSEWLRAFTWPYFVAGDHDEKPFTRADRSWVYRAAKNVENIISFGSTRDFNAVGSPLFVDAPYPVLKRDTCETSPIIIGPGCRQPYAAKSLFNASGMSFGAISKNAVQAMSAGIKQAGCWMNTGEGGISPYHLAGGADLVAQIGTAKFGFRTESGELSDERLKAAAELEQVKMFEIKLSQGAKPGKGGLLPAAKVTDEIAKVRGIKPHTDCYSPNRHPDIANNQQLIAAINHIRDITGKPTGFKVAIGEFAWFENLCEEINKQGIESAPDFITIDGGEGGTGAAPKPLMDYMGLSISESLPVVVDILNKYQLRHRIKVIASGQLIRPGAVAWALCCGADFVVSARGFLFALGCIQAMRCHTNNCPTGITTHKRRYTRGLDIASRAKRIAHYVKNVNYEVEMISHSCGVHEPRQLKRKHVRIVTGNGTTISLEKLCKEHYDSN